MAPKVQVPLPPMEVRPSDIRAAHSAKAPLRNADVWKPQIGIALQRAVSLVGWSLKEFSAAVNRDPRQCARWISGVEPTPLAVIFSVSALRGPFVIALAEVSGDEVSIVTTITVKRVA